MLKYNWVLRCVFQYNNYVFKEKEKDVEGKPSRQHAAGIFRAEQE